jgi:hypothetical protein
MVDPVVAPALAIGSIVTFGLHFNSIPPHDFVNPYVRVEKLYKVDDRIVADAVLDPDAEQEACPVDPQIIRQTSRQENGREYLVWVLRCRISSD